MNSIVFGGIDSSDYGIYISGEGVWNAPERDAETIKIPGRNGEYILDHGNFKNIEVTYPAFNQEVSYNDFRTKVDNFRNAISSLKGYQRLTDSFHPDEYRMAAFIGGLEVKPVLYNDKSMETNIVFNCKPQRFLTSGEAQQTISSGATITNPTLFESHPLLLVDGYGDININDDVISIQQGAVMGETILSPSTTGNGGALTINLDKLYVNGDEITVGKPSSMRISAIVPNGHALKSVAYQGGDDSVVYGIESQNDKDFRMILYLGEELTFTAGTSGSAIGSARFDIVTERSGTEYTSTLTVRFDYQYTAGNTDALTLRGMWGTSSGNSVTVAVSNLTIPEVKVNSTKSALGQLYIDLDIGECYRIENGQYISINTATILPADLPTFKPGTNTITYDNTFTSFKVTSRWWKV